MCFGFICAFLDATGQGQGVPRPRECPKKTDNCHLRLSSVALSWSRSQTLYAGDPPMTKGICSVIALIALCGTLATAGHFRQANARSGSTRLRTLKPPANGVINVAVMVSDNTALIDLAGPWEVFVDTMLTSQGRPWRGGDDMIMPFNIYSVSDSQRPISA